MKLLLLTLLLVDCAWSAFAQVPKIEPGVSKDLAAWRAAHYSDVRYSLSLTLEKMSPVLKGTIEIRVNVGTRTPSSASPQSGETPPIILDWRKLSGHEKDSTESNVTLNGRPASPQTAIADGGVRVPANGVPTKVPYEESNEHLIFRDGVVSGENVIKLDFTSPILMKGSGVLRSVKKKGRSEGVYSNFISSSVSTAFPVLDQPDLKAGFQLTVRRPDGWRVISNAIGHDLYLDNYSTRPFANVFAETKPISIYDFYFKAGPKK